MTISPEHMDLLDLEIKHRNDETVQFLIRTVRALENTVADYESGENDRINSLEKQKNRLINALRAAGTDVEELAECVFQANESFDEKFQKIIDDLRTAADESE